MSSSSSEESSSLSSQEESLSSSSEEHAPDYYSQLVFLAPIYNKEVVVVGCSLDLCEPDQRYQKVVRPLFINTGGTFEGVDVVGGSTEVEAAGFFRAEFERLSSQEEIDVIAAWFDYMIDSVKQFLYTIRTEGASVVYVDPLELEVF
jgi:hypothetical protein